MIKGILFDLDNTLIDFMKMKKASCDAAIEAMIAAGVDLPKERATKVLFDLYGEYGIEYDQIFQRFLEKIQQKIDYKILAAGIVAYRKAQEAYKKPYPKVIPTLIKLREKGIKAAIVSDAPRLKAWIRLTELGLQDFFDAVVAQGDVNEMKPSRIPFEKALAELDLKPNEVLMIGDWPERDIAGAKVLGMKTCFARYGYQRGAPPKTDADYEIDGIEELLDIVGKAVNG